MEFLQQKTFTLSNLFVFFSNFKFITFKDRMAYARSSGSEKKLYTFKNIFRVDTVKKNLYLFQHVCRISLRNFFLCAKKKHAYAKREKHL